MGTATPAEGHSDIGTDAGDDLLEGRVAERLRELGSVCVALSGGVDSSLVLTLAVRTLGPARVTAFTASSATTPASEMAAARALTESLGVEHVLIETSELADERFASNTRERCYFCKRHLIDEMEAVARARGRAALVDGANVDDLSDERPGLRATAERGVRHPLVEGGMDKRAVRRLARKLGLVVWDAPAQACLASRIPYGERITEEKLRRVGEAEKRLHGLGFRQCRVRAHGGLARVEVERDDIARAVSAAADIVAGLHGLGFTYVTLDLEGFRSGSMNEAPLGANGTDSGAAADSPAPPDGADVVP